MMMFVQKALEHKPKLIVAGASAYPSEIDFEKFREIADEVGAYFMVDMAHIAGLVAAGEHPVSSAICTFHNNNNAQNITWSSRRNNS